MFRGHRIYSVASLNIYNFVNFSLFGVIKCSKIIEGHKNSKSALKTKKKNYKILKIEVKVIIK